MLREIAVYDRACRDRTQDNSRYTALRLLMFTRMRFSVTVCSFVSALAITPAHGQKIRVAVAVQDTASGGIFSSGFASALRALGDVDVVSSMESHDYAVRGVVLCSDTCSNTRSYSLAIRFVEPMPSSVAGYLTSVAFFRLPGISRARRDSVESQFRSSLEGYEKTHMTWAAEWGRQRYEQAVREMVAELDSKCFEKERAFRRAIQSTDTAAFGKYTAFARSRSWLC
jgi:hypothetical protein